MAIPNIPVPSRAVLGVAALLGFAFVSVALARIEKVSATPIPFAPVAETQILQFTDRADGAVLALREDGTVQAVIAPETGGFVRGVLRALVRSRAQLGLGREDGGFALNRLSDGHITLSDPATGQQVDLGAFGPTNQAAFAAIMTPETGQ
ncbi:photosynthetic complex assembly protein PuhC [Acuticoccus kandeliae]|uniref:photosynthetic complex assembly protein PuhC n=1 Tax=Acuticoccus kandeliae TaxID=2073160 RepID=UPI001300B896|nr:photosynthetic complex assembly protein PuhC [Acuticoccus kandeliae]